MFTTSPFLSYSYDGGETWTLAQTTGLKSGESCTCLRKFPDSNTLLLIWNDADFIPQHHHFGERTPLSLAISLDEGRTWKRLGNIAGDDNTEYTNINCTFLSDGKAFISYMKTEPFKRTRIDLYAASVRI